MSTALKISAYQQPARLPEKPAASQNAATASKNSDFQQVLKSQLAGAGPLQFSKHAAQRLESRGLNLGKEQLEKISSGLDKAAKSGSKETLVLTNDAALLVAVPSRTVVTVFDRDHLKNGVVTAIDSALII